MSKKSSIYPLLMASTFASQYNIQNYNPINQKELVGSAIYIPKRHKFKRRYKR